MSRRQQAQPPQQQQQNHGQNMQQIQYHLQQEQIRMATTLPDLAPQDTEQNTSPYQIEYYPLQQHLVEFQRNLVDVLGVLSTVSTLHPKEQLAISKEVEDVSKLFQPEPTPEELAAKKRESQKAAEEAKHKKEQEEKINKKANAMTDAIITDSADPLLNNGNTTNDNSTTSKPLQFLTDTDLNALISSAFLPNPTPQPAGGDQDLTNIKDLTTNDNNLDGKNDTTGHIMTILDGEDGDGDEDDELTEMEEDYYGYIAPNDISSETDIGDDEDNNNNTHIVSNNKTIGGFTRRHAQHSIRLKKKKQFLNAMRINNQIGQSDDDVDPLGIESQPDTDDEDPVYGGNTVDVEKKKDNDNNTTTTNTIPTLPTTATQTIVIDNDLPFNDDEGIDNNNNSGVQDILPSRSSIFDKIGVGGNMSIPRGSSASSATCMSCTTESDVETSDFSEYEDLTKLTRKNKTLNNSKTVEGNHDIDEDAEDLSVEEGEILKLMDEATILAAMNNNNNNNTNTNNNQKSFTQTHSLLQSNNNTAMFGNNNNNLSSDLINNTNNNTINNKSMGDSIDTGDDTDNAPISDPEDIVTQYRHGQHYDTMALYSAINNDREISDHSDDLEDHPTNIHNPQNHPHMQYMATNTTTPIPYEEFQGADFETKLMNYLEQQNINAHSLTDALHNMEQTYLSLLIDLQRYANQLQYAEAQSTVEDFAIYPHYPAHNVLTGGNAFANVPCTVTNDAALIATGGNVLGDIDYRALNFGDIELGATLDSLVDFQFEKVTQQRELLQQQQQTQQTATALDWNDILLPELPCKSRDNNINSYTTTMGGVGWEIMDEFSLHRLSGLDTTQPFFTDAQQYGLVDNNNIDSYNGGGGINDVFMDFAEDGAGRLKLLQKEEEFMHLMGRYGGVGTELYGIGPKAYDFDEYSSAHCTASDSADIPSECGGDSTDELMAVMCEEVVGVVEEMKQQEQQKEKENNFQNNNNLQYNNTTSGFDNNDYHYNNQNIYNNTTTINTNITTNGPKTTFFFTKYAKQMHKLQELQQQGLIHNNNGDDDDDDEQSYDPILINNLGVDIEDKLSTFETTQIDEEWGDLEDNTINTTSPQQDNLQTVGVNSPAVSVHSVQSSYGGYVEMLPDSDDDGSGAKTPKNGNNNSNNSNNNSTNPAFDDKSNYLKKMSLRKELPYDDSTTTDIDCLSDPNEFVESTTTDDEKEENNNNNNDGGNNNNIQNNNISSSSTTTPLPNGDDGDSSIDEDFEFTASDIDDNNNNEYCFDSDNIDPDDDTSDCDNNADEDDEDEDDETNNNNNDDEDKVYPSKLTNTRSNNGRRIYDSDEESDNNNDINNDQIILDDIQNNNNNNEDDTNPFEIPTNLIDFDDDYCNTSDDEALPQPLLIPSQIIPQDAINDTFSNLPTHSYTLLHPQVIMKGEHYGQILELIKNFGLISPNLTIPTPTGIHDQPCGFPLAIPQLNASQGTLLNAALIAERIRVMAKCCYNLDAFLQQFKMKQ